MIKIIAMFTLYESVRRELFIEKTTREITKCDDLMNLRKAGLRDPSSLERIMLSACAK